MEKFTPKYILVIEDEAAIRDLVKFTLEAAQFKVMEAQNYQQTKLALAERLPNLIIIDWMLPGASGIKITKQLRQDFMTQTIPIIMLTAKAEEDNRVKGLEAGADDYIVKPFSPRELVARIKAVLRRGVLMTPNEIVNVQEIIVDLANHKITIRGHDVELSQTEYRLLVFFLTHPNRAYNRTYLLNHVWGQDAFIEERTVDVHIRRLRKILLPYGYAQYLQTVRGFGYRYVT